MPVSSSKFPELAAILSRWPIDVTDVITVDSSGFSGARVFQIILSDQRKLGLKHYRGPTLTVRGLDEIHRVLIHAHNQGCDFVAQPMRLADGFSTVVAGQPSSATAGLWELSRWVPGSPKTSFNNAQVKTAFASIARFHQAAAQINLAFRTSPHLPYRQIQLAKLIRPQSDTLDRATDALKHVPIDPGWRRSLSLLIDQLKMVPPSQINALQIAIDRFIEIDLPVHPVIRDLRAEHLLFTDDQLTGLVDFDAMEMDSVAYDLSRLTSSMGLDENQLHVALSTYHAIRPIQPDEAALTQLLTSVSKLLSPLSWVEWIVLEQRTFANPAAVQRRLNELVAI